MNRIMDAILEAQKKQPKHNHVEAFKHMKYQSDDKKVTVIVWNSRDGVTPFCFPLPGTEIMLQHIDWRNDIYAPNYKPKPGDFIFRDYTQAEAEASAKARCDFAREHGFKEEGIEDLYNEALADIVDNRQPKLEIIKP